MKWSDSQFNKIANYNQFKILGRIGMKKNVLLHLLLFQYNNVEEVYW